MNTPRKKNDVLPGAGLRGQELWRFLFDPDHSPAVETAMKDTRDKIGWFPSYKGRGKVDLLRTRRTIVHDFLYLAETDPDVVRIVDLPIEARYWRGTGNGVKTRHHVPDLALGLRDGSIVFVDVERYWEIRSRSGWEAKQDALIEHFAHEHDARYMLHDETKVFPQPLYDNAKAECEHGRRQFMHDGYEIIRNEIRRHPKPATIHELMQACSLNAMTWRFAEDPPDAAVVLKQINPVYSVVLQLVVDGELWVDEGSRFSLDTVVDATAQLGRRKIV